MKLGNGNSGTGKDFKSLAVADLLKNVEMHDQEVVSRGITPNAIKRPVNAEEVMAKK